MKHILLFVFCFLAGACNLQGQEAPTGVAKNQLNGDLSSIRKLSEELNLLFNRGEVNGIASRFLADR